MKNVKTLIIVALMGASLFASTTRTDALGGAGFWAEDFANVASFPADVNNHNVAWTDGTDFTSIFNANGTTWGFTGGSDDEVVNMMWGNGSMGASFGLGMTPEVEATMTCGDAMDEDCGDAADAETALNIGFGMPLAGMDFGFTYDTGCDGTMGCNNMGINLRRAQNVWLWDTMLINFGMVNEVKEEDAITTSSNMKFGASFYSNTAYESGTNGLFAFGFGYSDAGAYDAVVDDVDTADVDETMAAGDDDAAMTINWNFAVESAMTDWATLRVGYGHGYDFANGGDAGAFTIGLGFNYGSFNLDMALANGDMFNDPVSYMTGRNSTALGTDWTISYAW